MICMLKTIETIVDFNYTNCLPAIKILYKINIFIKDATTRRKTYELRHWKNVEVERWDIKKIKEQEIYKKYNNAYNYS